MFDIVAWHVWLVLALLLLVGEMIIPGTYLLFFAIGAFAATATALFGLDVYIQLSVFAVVTLLLGFIIRKLLPSSGEGAAKTNAQALIGARASVVEEIPGGDSEGLVKVWGERWRARSEKPLAVGASVEVTDVSGTLLHVKKSG